MMPGYNSRSAIQIYFTFCTILLNLLKYNNASLQRRPALLPIKLCDKPCFNGGTCINGVCVCPPGWAGLQCDQCFGRIKKQQGVKGYLTDGPMQYSPSAKCIWVLENDRPGPLLFKFEEFFTECCWDHLYVWDGDGTFNSLLGVFSGSLSGTELVAKSGRAIVYFSSDLAFNLPGFNISYEFGVCPKNCSGHGRCLIDGSCYCQSGYTGEHCQFQICTSENEDRAGPCLNRALCKNRKCVCRNNYHGDFCQELSQNPVWDVVPTIDTHIFQSRASHKLIYLPAEQVVWIFGGLVFNNKRNSNEMIYYNVTKQQFHLGLSDSEIRPSYRYDHSMVYRKGKLYIFGGVINENMVTNEFWSFDTLTRRWEKLSYHNDSQFSLPMSSAGHTAHLVNDEMHVIFGYNNFEGYVFTSQIFSFGTGKWYRSSPDPEIMGRFGHASSVFEDVDKTVKILIHGGYNAPFSGYSYSISDELLLYDPVDQSCTKIGNSGVPLFRHSAVIVDGIMLILGGNSHNESSAIRKNDCYSNQVFAYDIICKKWLPISIKEFDLASRYGHDTFSDGKDVYVVGGFNGQILNDILKFTPAKCDRRVLNPDDCENFANGIRCIYQNKTCIERSTTNTLRQPFISLIKGDSQRTFQYGCKDSEPISEILVSCGGIKDCVNCVARKNCGWCDGIQTCLNSDAACADDALLTDKNKCPFGKMQKMPQRLRPCNLATNCYSCRQLKHCSWFSIDTRNSCVSLENEVALIEEYNKNQENFGSNSQATQISTVINLTEQTPLSNNIMSTGMKRVSNSTCPAPCFVHSTCQTCISLQCMWCPSTRRCVTMDSYMISFPYGQCQSWVTAANNACQFDPYDCGLQKTCNDCQSIGTRCGWCDDGSGTGLGRCLEGTNSGPLNENACSAAKWFFTGAPVCQCNGHSTCTENTTQERKCRNCQNRTRGDHCEQCDFGYFGDPRNGGSCQECECSGQAKFCNTETGDCYCSTKGVTGPHCDRCETKYLGDPRANKPCTYELATDFIFTFKLDGEDAKDKYVNSINFFSTPSKRDTDVQFSMICDGESGARVSINLTNHMMDRHHIHTKQLMSLNLCTSTGLKRTYPSSDAGFAFGTESNTTFYVKVSDFITPIKIQISFAQSPPINWMLFFVIFAACFIILLVVAGLLWMIKLRVEWYRNIRRRNDEMVEMASRPLGCVHLDMSRGCNQIMPISVEPCRNNQFGVYTLIVRLPTGGPKLTYTPYGASGLATGSSICYLTQAQLALLAPPSLEKHQNRKFRFLPWRKVVVSC